MAATNPIAIRLHQALKGDALPPEGRSIGQRLLTQLNQATRVAVIGLAGSGKTSLVNMLLGARLMPDLDGPASIELAFAETARVKVTLADGSVRAHDGGLETCHVPPEAVRVVVELPDQLLKEWTFLEVRLSETGPDQEELLEWMTQRSDIAIWCSQSFSDRERRMWSPVPDRLKDHSFLALTRADRLFMKGELADRIARLQPVVEDEFLGLYPIATLQAAASRKADAEQNHALWQSSGAKAFVEAIRQQVDQARTASLDHAYILLERFKAALAEPDLSARNGPAIQQTTAAATAQTVVVGRTLAEPVQRKPDTNAVIRDALNILQGCAEDLLATPDGGNSTVADGILERCCMTADALVQLFSEVDSTDPDLNAVRDDAIEGEQMLMLLRLERGETAAEDSLTVLLQLKKEMSERIAT